MKKAVKKTKTMYAVVQLVADREDPEDSSAEIVKVFKSKKAADKGLVEARKEFLLECVADDIEEAEALLDSDCERYYSWSVKPVKVEV